MDPATGAIVLGPGSSDAAKQGLRKYYLRPEDRPTRAAPVNGGGGGGAEGEGVAGTGTSGGGGGGRGGEKRAVVDDDDDDDVGEYLVPMDGADEGGEALGEWLSGLHRDRYKVVRDERDAYMNLQVRNCCAVLLCAVVCCEGKEIHRWVFGVGELGVAVACSVVCCVHDEVLCVVVGWVVGYKHTCRQQE